MEGHQTEARCCEFALHTRARGLRLGAARRGARRGRGPWGTGERGGGERGEEQLGVVWCRTSAWRGGGERGGALGRVWIQSSAGTCEVPPICRCCSCSAKPSPPPCRAESSPSRTVFLPPLSSTVAPPSSLSLSPLPSPLSSHPTPSHALSRFFPPGPSTPPSIPESHHQGSQDQGTRELAQVSFF